MKLDIVEIIDNDDGSCTVTFDMDQETLKIFAGIGINKVLLDSADKVIKENSNITEEDASQV